MFDRTKDLKKVLNYRQLSNITRCVFGLIPAETVLITNNTNTASGQTARVELMKQTFCLGGLPEHVTEKDVHSVASVLKVGHIIYTLSAYRPSHDHKINLR